MYAQHHSGTPLRYSPHHGPGFYEEQQRQQFHSGRYSPAYGHMQGGYAPHGYPVHAGYGRTYPGSRVIQRPPQYAVDEDARREQQDARYSEIMNGSPTPFQPAPPNHFMGGYPGAMNGQQMPFQPPSEQMGDMSTIDSEEQEPIEYTVDEEENPFAKFSCTNLMFGNDQKAIKKEIKNLEKSVDKYVQKNPNIMEAFQCKAEPVHSSKQYAHYVQPDQRTVYMDPVYGLPQRQMNASVAYGASVAYDALFSQGSASSEEEEDVVVEAPVPSKHAPRDIVIEDHNDAVSVLSDTFTPQVRTMHRRGQLPLSPHNRREYGVPSMSPMKPVNKGFFPPSSPPSSNIPTKMNEKLDENGLQKDDSNSEDGDEIDKLIKYWKKRETSISSPQATNVDKYRIPSFDEPKQTPKSHSKTTLRKKAEILDDDNDTGVVLRRKREIQERMRETPTNELAGETTELGDELMGKSPKNEGQSLMAETGGDEMMDAIEAARASPKKATKRVEQVFEEEEETFEDAHEEEESQGEVEVDYMPSTMAAAALIDSMMGTLDKTRLPKISEDSEYIPPLEDPLSFDGSVMSRSLSTNKRLYRYL